ncbi:hypothetical protein CCH79_00016230 [Gambusia affinis]|uniref:C2H2-type domain-containing protein n=1 Tax=Gambusia affinis TaxID=33528 RepID=A0A315VMC0_GAMAF|nr:hypothetical protein CCH79_00016230 [Gambusia affinis]
MFPHQLINVTDCSYSPQSADCRNAADIQGRYLLFCSGSVSICGSSLRDKWSGQDWACRVDEGHAAMATGAESDLPCPVRMEAIFVSQPYQCGHCSQSFSQPSELRNHVVTHSSDRPFKCGYCGRAFAGATTLNNHIRTHTGEKPFK